jgi:hypothetical protein
MRIAEAVRTIGEFWECAPLPWAGGGLPHLERLGQAFSLTLPDELRTYKWSDQLDDEDLGDDLPPEAADWLFPRMRTWSGESYGCWCDDFTNV